MTRVKTPEAKKKKTSNMRPEPVRPAEKPLVRISVRSLVEFILRSGDLSAGSGAMDREAMQKGSRLHRKLQKQAGGNYRAEVVLKRDSEYDDLILRVEGRADGIFTEDGTVCIDEIKGVYKNMDALTEPVPVHRAQAVCYAFIYLEQQKLDKIGVQMTYANLDTEEVRRFRENLDRETLEKWYRDLTDEYHKWVSYQREWREKRNASMARLEFPFPYRPGQRDMVAGVYHAIRQKQQIFIQAPTGVGKTMSAVFPAVRSIGQGQGEILFYLTARTITRTVAQDAFAILRKKGLLFKVVTLTAKEKLCLSPEGECSPEKCPFAKGHFDRINSAVFDLWTVGEAFDRETIRTQAEKFRVCPFELALDLSVWTDGVICDYNYVFDPNVYLKRFFGENASGKYIFLIDEAHNLVERGREMYSASLYREDVKRVRKLIRQAAPKLYRLLGKVNRSLSALEKECGSGGDTENGKGRFPAVPDSAEGRSFKVHDNTGTLPLSLLAVQGELEKLLEEPPAPELTDEILEFYFTVRDFLNISELADEHYVVYTAWNSDGRFFIKLFCVNPAANLQKRLDLGLSAVFFSATLLPLHYYRKLLSTRSENFGMYVTSPFNPRKRCLLAGTDVSSRYRRRGYEEYKKIAAYIVRMASQKRGNYMVFFPSYKLMEEVFRVYEDEFSVPWIRCIRQEAGMTEREREEFLGEFSAENTSALVAFCVMGGIFAEGIDLTGNRLIGAAIVGTGLPGVSGEREILRQYYDKKGENGFDYAYRYPGMNKVLQAAGRVIRTKEDTGVILLLDERFRTREYRELFPREWTDIRFRTLANVEEDLKRFWGEYPEN